MRADGERAVHETRVSICPLAELVRGEGRRVATDPPIAVFRTETDEVYALDDTCTHQDASLAEGWVEGHLVECPLHASSFDLRTGEVDGPPAKVGVRTHRVIVTEGAVEVVIES